MSVKHQPVCAYYEHDTGTPEQKLAAAVLIRAMQDYAIRQQPSFKRRYTAYFHLWAAQMNEIREYFDEQPNDDPYPFSFVWCCQALSVDWEGLQALIVKYLERGEFQTLFHANKGSLGFKALFN